MKLYQILKMQGRKSVSNDSDSYDYRLFKLIFTNSEMSTFFFDLRCRTVITTTGNDHKPPQSTSKRPQTTTNHHKPPRNDHKPPQTTTNHQQTTTIKVKPNKTSLNSNTRFRSFTLRMRCAGSFIFGCKQSFFIIMLGTLVNHHSS